MTVPNTRICKAFAQAVTAAELSYSPREAFQLSEAINGFSDAHIESLNGLSERNSVGVIASLILHDWRNP